MNDWTRLCSRIAIFSALSVSLGGLAVAIAPASAEASCRYVQGNRRLIAGSRAQLYANDRGSRINIREGASTATEALHYGLDGDAVTVLDSTFNGRDCALWFFVEFDASGARGWVHGNFIEPR